MNSLSTGTISFGAKKKSEYREDSFHYSVRPEKLALKDTRVQSDSDRSQNCVVGVYRRKSRQYHEQYVCPNFSNSESQTPVNKFRGPL